MQQSGFKFSLVNTFTKGGEGEETLFLKVTGCVCKCSEVHKWTL